MRRVASASCAFWRWFTRKMSANTRKAVPDATTGQTMEDHSQGVATRPFASGKLRNILGDQGTLYAEVMELLPRPRCMQAASPSGRAADDSVGEESRDAIG